MIQFDFVLIRGLSREAGHWGEFAKVLEKQAYCKSVNCIDLPGAGVYHKISSPLSISENAEFVVSKIKDKNIEQKNIVIVSVSLGSMVAIEMASRYPELFSKVYVMNTSLSSLSPFYHRLQLKALMNFYQILKSSSLKQKETEVLKMVSNAVEKWPSIIEEWTEIAQLRPVKIQNSLKQLVAASRYSLPKERPESPIVVMNSSCDQMVHHSCSEALAKIWNLPLFTHPTAGHELALDDPEWVIEKIQESLL